MNFRLALFFFRFTSHSHVFAFFIFFILIHSQSIADDSHNLKVEALSNTQVIEQFIESIEEPTESTQEAGILPVQIQKTVESDKTDHASEENFIKIALTQPRKIKKQKSKKKSIVSQDMKSGLLVYKNEGYFYKVTLGSTLYNLAKRYFDFSDTYNYDDFCIKTVKLNNLNSASLLPLNKEIRLPIISEEPITSSTPLKRTNSSTFSKPRGIYMNAYVLSSLTGKKLIHEFHQAGGNTLIVDMKDVEGNIYFPTRTDLSQNSKSVLNNVIPNFHKTINYAHALGMQVVVRLTCFANKKLANHHKDYALRDKNDHPIVLEKRLHWVDPGNEKVAKHLLSLADELCAHYGIDEIQLDYVRFPDYKGSLNRAYPEMEREDLILRFVKSMQKVTKFHDRPLSLAVFGIVAWDNDRDVSVLGQNIPNLARHCDGIHSMLYSSHFAKGFAGIEKPADHPGKLVNLALNEIKANLKPETKINLSPWLQAFKYELTDYDEEYILKNINSASAHGGGFFFWNASNDYEILLNTMRKIKKKQEF